MCNASENHESVPSNGLASRHDSLDRSALATGLDNPRKHGEILDERSRLEAAVGGDEVDGPLGDHWAEFDNQPAAGKQSLGGLRDEALDCLRAGGTGNERLPRLVVFNLGRELLVFRF